MSTIQNEPESGSALRGWLAVSAVTLGIFALMTSELLPVGLLTPVSTDLKITEGQAGLMVTAPGLVAALAAPVLTIAAGRLDRRVMLTGLIGLMALANLVSAMATTFTVVLVARLAVGISVGGFWAIAGGLALRLVPQQHVGRATAVIFGGVSTASVLGVPAGTFAGQIGGWRLGFAIVGLLGLGALACLVLFVPALPATRTISFAEMPRLWRTPSVRAGIVLTLLLITGQFAAYTYLRPILQEIAGIPPNSISLMLLAYGVAGVVGNFVAGSQVTRHPRGTLLGIGVTLTAVTSLLAAYGAGAATAVLAVIVWGLAYGGVSVSLQTWMLKAAPQATEAASSLFVAAFNLSIALGALLGGLVVDGFGTFAALWLAAAFLLSSILVVTAHTKYVVTAHTK
ncbi:MFS transporter [Nonomuraea sp. NPDC047897]|uniref:MFS transporter n=1 Tax=Nonomuraea sp. NPDC047897 TaxID=3364346 RepID=UPI003723FB5F